MVLSSHVNIKNVFTQMARTDTDEQSKVWIGGGKSNAVNQVGQEFGDITGGSNINWTGRHGNELEELLEAILTSNGRNDIPGLQGVELLSITSDSFVISFEGWMSSKNMIEFTGSYAEQAISAVTSPIVDLKNSNSQVIVFDSDVTSSVFMGSDSNTSAEVREILGGSRMDMSEAAELLTAATSGSTKNGTNGVEGVELVGLTDEGFTLRIDGSRDTTDTFIFKGQGALDAMEFADSKHNGSNALLHDKNNGFDIFDVAEERGQFVAKLNGFVSEEFIEAVSQGGIGRRITQVDVIPLFEALITGNARRGDTGLEGVELVGMNDTSFSLAIEGQHGTTDYVLFKNVHLLDGANDLGFSMDTIA